ncbi:hypothetical protein F5Y18DRAFT_398811, partial [Xylariaceae sp. FL1019]
MFHIVQKQDPRFVRLWVRYGGDVNAIWTLTGLPLLAYAILCGKNTRKEATEVLTTLLALGASPDVIPRVFYTPCNRDLPSEFSKEELNDLGKTNSLWRNPVLRQALKDALNLTQRYRLFEASRM